VHALHFSNCDGIDNHGFNTTDLVLVRCPDSGRERPGGLRVSDLDPVCVTVSGVARARELVRRRNSEACIYAIVTAVSGVACTHANFLCAR
jgi:hypothetical protein